MRRIAADLAESATTDDRVKDRLGGWQDSETRKQIYQDRQTDELRAEAAKVRRELRLGAKPEANGTKPSLDLDALLAALTPEQQALLAAKINAPTGPGTGPEKKIAGTRSDPGDYKRLELQDFQRAGDGTRTHDVQLGKEAEKQGLSRSTRQFPSQDVMLGPANAKHFVQNSASNGSRNGSRGRAAHKLTPHPATRRMSNGDSVRRPD